MTMTPLTALQQYSASSLQPGEEFVAGIAVAAPQSAHQDRNFLLGGIAGSIVLDAMDQHKTQKASTISIPVTGVIIGATQSRILVFKHNMKMQPAEVIGSVEREGLSLDSEEFRQGLVKRIHFTLVKDSTIVVDGVCSPKNSDLDAFRQLLPAAVRA